MDIKDIEKLKKIADANHDIQKISHSMYFIFDSPMIFN